MEPVSPGIIRPLSTAVTLLAASQRPLGSQDVFHSESVARTCRPSCYLCCHSAHVLLAFLLLSVWQPREATCLLAEKRGPVTSSGLLSQSMCQTSGCDDSGLRPWVDRPLIFAEFFWCFHHHHHRNFHFSLACIVFFFFTVGSYVHTFACRVALFHPCPSPSSQVMNKHLGEIWSFAFSPDERLSNVPHVFSERGRFSQLA